MKTINPALLALARQKTWDNARQIKQADGMMPGAPPPAGPPMPGPAAAPPPAPMGAQMGGPMAAPQAPAGQSASGKPKFDPLMLDYRMYNMQQQLTAIMNALKITLPPESIIMPPGTNGAPPAEAAIQGGPNAPAPTDQSAAAAQGQADPAAAFPPIEPMQGFDPAAAGGGMPKAGGTNWLDHLLKSTATTPAGRFMQMVESKQAADAARREKDEKLAAEIRTWPLRADFDSAVAAARSIAASRNQTR